MKNVILHIPPHPTKNEIVLFWIPLILPLDVIELLFTPFVSVCVDFHVKSCLNSFCFFQVAFGEFPCMPWKLTIFQLGSSL